MNDHFRLGYQFIVGAGVRPGLIACFRRRTIVGLCRRTIRRPARERQAYSGATDPAIV